MTTDFPRHFDSKLSEAILSTGFSLVGQSNHGEPSPDSPSESATFRVSPGTGKARADPGAPPSRAVPGACPFFNTQRRERARNGPGTGPVNDACSPLHPRPPPPPPDSVGAARAGRRLGGARAAETNSDPGSISWAKSQTATRQRPASRETRSTSLLGRHSAGEPRGAPRGPRGLGSRVLAAS